MLWSRRCLLSLAVVVLGSHAVAASSSVSVSAKQINVITAKQSDTLDSMLIASLQSQVEKLTAALATALAEKQESIKILTYQVENLQETFSSTVHSLLTENRELKKTLNAKIEMINALGARISKLHQALLLKLSYKRQHHDNIDK